MAETRRVPLASTGLEKGALQVCLPPWHQQRPPQLPTHLVGEFAESRCVSRVTSGQIPVLQGAGTNSIMWCGLGFKKKLYGEGGHATGHGQQDSHTVPFAGARAPAGCCVPSAPTRDPLPLLSLLVGHV